jgi:hypothetical protein
MTEAASGKSNLGLAVLCAAFVFTAGFGVLNALYWPIRDEVPEPGLYGYWASSFGDAVLLPAAAFVLVRANAQLRANRAAVAIGATAGGLAGVLLQASWLADPAPGLNWTLVAPGTFNAAGWYHAAFLVVTAAFLTALAARLVAGWFAIGQVHRRYAATLIGIFIAFGVLLILDNTGVDAMASRATLVVIAGCALGTATAAVIVALRRRSREQSS